MFYIYIPSEMRRQMVLDANAILMLQEPACTGIWETFQGELYVSKDSPNENK